MGKRYPVQIGNWKVDPKPGFCQPEELLNLIIAVLEELLPKCKKPGILLSGGIDSTLLAVLANRIQKIPCFTIGSSINHPDVIAATKIAHEFDFDHYFYIPSLSTEMKTNEQYSFKYPGDTGVFLSLDFAAKYLTDILATDGIDEQMGGYWWHIHRNEQFPQAEQAFEHFWNELESKHLTPMFEAAQKVGLNLYWVYLHPLITEYIAQIPLNERVGRDIGKAFWRQTAKIAGIPDWVINRAKRGFVDALSDRYCEAS
jgi:asparagine synthase (glutamine-hydrolysing)